MKAILEHGLKKSSILGGSTHPWLFVEEASRAEIDKDYDSVYARLVLCKTFRCDGLTNSCSSLKMATRCHSRSSDLSLTGKLIGCMSCCIITA